MGASTMMIKPQLYIISLTHSEINLRDPKCTEFSGYIYSPKSKVLLPTNNESPAQITGSVIAMNSTISQI